MDFLIWLSFQCIRSNTVSLLYYPEQSVPPTVGSIVKWRHLYLRVMKMMLNTTEGITNGERLFLWDLSAQTENKVTKHTESGCIQLHWLWALSSFSNLRVFLFRNSLGSHHWWNHVECLVSLCDWEDYSLFQLDVVVFGGGGSVQWLGGMGMKCMEEKHVQ